MTEEATFQVPDGAGDETGRYIVTMREDSGKSGLSVLQKKCGVAKDLPNAAEFEESAIQSDDIDSAGGAFFPSLGIAVVTLDDDSLNSAMGVVSPDSDILDIEPERTFYALGDTGTLTESSLRYLQGFRDGVDALYEQAAGASSTRAVDAQLEALFNDDAQSTWGIKATRTDATKFTGAGIRVAILDTGMDVSAIHPDFRGRNVFSRSFISGEPVQDGNGHGSHCVGTACGRKDLNGRRYGVAGGADIFVGKVLSNRGSGSTSGILAGMEWAITQGCQVISMSLGNTVPTPSTAYEAVGRRALQRGSIVIAAAGNHRIRGNNDFSRPGTVGQPANSPSIMAVAAVDRFLQLANFSCTSGTTLGASVDIAGPGVAVYSSVPDPFPATAQPSGRGRPWPPRYHTISGTSMATPHVAGIAALYAEAFQADGARLWQLLVSHAKRLGIPAADVGAGLVQSP